MNAPLLLRIASVLSFLFTAGHALGGRKSWSPLGENEVLRVMRTQHFDVMGVNRSFLDFYLGFGHSLSVFLLLQSVLLWQIAGLAATDAARIRPLVGAITLASLACGLLSWRYLFPVPALFSLVLTVCLACAYFAAR